MVSDFGDFDRPKPGKDLEKAGFTYTGYRDLEDEDGRAMLYQHPHLGKLEIHQGSLQDYGGERWERKAVITNPAPNFKPDLRDPNTLSLRERIESRQDYYSHFLDTEAQLRWKNQTDDENPSKEQVDRVKQEVATKIQSLVDTADVWIRIPPTKLAGILKEGKFKTLAESQKMGPGKAVGIAKYLPARDEAEEKLFNLPLGEMDEERPIYGYLSDHSDGHGPAFYEGKGQAVDLYGTVAIKLKPSVRSKTTMVVGDSLDLNAGSFGARVVPSFLDSIKAESTLGRSGDQLDATSILDLTRSGYTEAQIHGVNVDDFDEIVFHEPVNPAVIKRLEKLGITGREIERDQIEGKK